MVLASPFWSHLERGKWRTASIRSSRQGFWNQLRLLARIRRGVRSVGRFFSIARVFAPGGALVGFNFVGASFGINYQFAARSFKLWMIDAGYHTTQFMLFGLILGLWH